MLTKKGMSTHEIAKEVGVTQKTAWIFCAKIKTAMESSDLHLSRIGIKNIENEMVK